MASASRDKARGFGTARETLGRTRVSLRQPPDPMETGETQTNDNRQYSTCCKLNSLNKPILAQSSHTIPTWVFYSLWLVVYKARMDIVLPACCTFQVIINAAGCACKSVLAFMHTPL